MLQRFQQGLQQVGGGIRAGYEAAREGVRETVERTSDFWGRTEDDARDLLQPSIQQLQRSTKSFIEDRRDDIRRVSTKTESLFGQDVVQNVKSEIASLENKIRQDPRKEMGKLFGPERVIGALDIANIMVGGRREREWRPPYAIDKRDIELNIVENFALNTVSRLAELPARAVAIGSVDVANWIASGVADTAGWADFDDIFMEHNRRMDIGIDARRLGFKESTVRTAAGEMLDLIDEGLSPFEAGLLTFGNRTLEVAIGASIFNSVAGLTRNTISQAPKGIKKVEYWKQLGGPKNQKAITANKRNLAHKHHPDKGTGSEQAFKLFTEAESFLKKHGMPTKKDMLQYEAWRALEPFSKQSVVTRILKDPPVIRSPKGNLKLQARKWEEIWRDAANFPNRFFKYDGIKTGLRPHELANAENILKLPGYKPIPGQGPNIGLSIEKWQKVGGTHKQIVEELSRKYPKEQVQNIIRYRGEQLISDVGMFGIKQATDKMMLADVPNIVQPKISDTYQKNRDAVMSEQVTPVFPDKVDNLHELTPSLFKIADDSRLNKLHQLIKKTREGKQKDALLKRQVEEAKKSGIAIIKDSKGRDVPAMRDTGFYASEELTKFPIKDGGTPFTSPLNQALEQDAIFAIQEGMFGPSIRNNYFPVKEAVATKQRADIDSTKIAQQIAKDKNVKINKQTGGQIYDVWTTATRDDIANLSVLELKSKYPAIQKIDNNTVSAAQKLATEQDKARETANAVRDAMGLPPIGKVEKYGPQVQEIHQYQKVQADPQFDPGEVYDFIIPNFLQNKFAKPRVKTPSKKELNTNAWELQEMYMNAMNTDTYINPAIEQVKANLQVWKDQGKTQAVDYWENFIKSNLARRPTKVDQSLGVREGTIVKSGLDKLIDARIKASLIGNLSWNIATQPLSYLSLTTKETGLVNTFVKAPIKFLTQRDVASEVARDHTMILKEKKGHSAAYQGGLDAYDRTLFTKPMNKIADMLAVPAHAIERTLTAMSYMAGKDAGKAQGFTGEDLQHFASMSAEHTQSLYNRALRPPILNSTAVRAGFPFHTFQLEQWRHLKQIFGKGKMPADARTRLGMVANLTAGVFMMNIFHRATKGYTFTTPGDFVPFVGAGVDELIDNVAGTEFSYKRRDSIALVEDAFELSQGIGEMKDAYRELSSHEYEDIEDFAKEAAHYIKGGNLTNFRKSLVYWASGLSGMGGGQQVNRTVDFVIDAMQGYTEDMYGREWFPVELQDIPHGLIFGRHSTPSAREAREEMDQLDNYVEERQQSRDSADVRADRIHRKFEQMDSNEANMQLQELKEYDPQVARRVRDLATAEEELTAVQARFMSLGVEDGTRAAAIIEHYEGETVEEKNRIFNELRDAGVITDRVQLQIDQMLK